MRPTRSRWSTSPGSAPSPCRGRHPVQVDAYVKDRHRRVGSGRPDRPPPRLRSSSPPACSSERGRPPFHFRGRGRHRADRRGRGRLGRRPRRAAHREPADRRRAGHRRERHQPCRRHRRRAEPAAGHQDRHGAVRRRRPDGRRHAGQADRASRIPAGTTATATSRARTPPTARSTRSPSPTSATSPTTSASAASRPALVPVRRRPAPRSSGTSPTAPPGGPVRRRSTPVAPAAPAGAHLTGLELAFTGAVAAGAVATAQFLIAPTADVAARRAGRHHEHADGHRRERRRHRAAGTGAARVFFPDIELTLAKTITPSGAGLARARPSRHSSPATTSSDSAYVRPTSIVVEDVWRPGVANDFFNGFDPIAIAPTQVLKGSTLTVKYDRRHHVDATRHGRRDRRGAELPRRSLPPAATGLRFTFADAAGFAPGHHGAPVHHRSGARRPPRRQRGHLGRRERSQHVQNHAVADTRARSAAPVVTGARTADATRRSSPPPAPARSASPKKWTKTDLTGDVTDLPSQSGRPGGHRAQLGRHGHRIQLGHSTDPAATPRTPSRPCSSRSTSCRTRPSRSAPTRC